MRQGRLSLEEQKYIRDNIKTMHYETMAAYMDRDPVSISKWIQQNIGLDLAEQEESEGYNNLKKKAYWKELKEQFSESELKMFVYHWNNLWAQFKDDVFHTEEIQIVDTIKLEILTNRSLKDQNETIKKISDLEELIYEAHKEADETDDEMLQEDLKRRIGEYNRQIAMFLTARDSLSRDYKDLQTKKNQMIEKLKGSREQRIKQIDDVSTKQTFAGLLKKIILDPEFRKKAGRDMEKMRLAMDKERERLAVHHIYMDGNIDQPILNSDTFKDA